VKEIAGLKGINNLRTVFQEAGEGKDGPDVTVLGTIR